MTHSSLREIAKPNLKEVSAKMTKTLSRILSIVALIALLGGLFTFYHSTTADAGGEQFPRYFKAQLVYDDFPSSGWDMVASSEIKLYLSWYGEIKAGIPNALGYGSHSHRLYGTGRHGSRPTLKFTTAPNEGGTNLLEAQPLAATCLPPSMIVERNGGLTTTTFRAGKYGGVYYGNRLLQPYEEVVIQGVSSGYSLFPIDEGGRLSYPCAEYRINLPFVEAQPKVSYVWSGNNPGELRLLGEELLGDAPDGSGVLKPQVKVVRQNGQAYEVEVLNATIREITIRQPSVSPAVTLPEQAKLTVRLGEHETSKDVMIIGNLVQPIDRR